MTIQHIVLIGCDGWGERQGRCYASVAGNPVSRPNPVTVRTAARREGWTEVKVKGRRTGKDYCPDCGKAKAAAEALGHPPSEWAAGGGGKGA